MQYTVSRNGQTFGPYTLEVLQAYKDSGNILLTDLVNVEGSSEWVTVASVLGVPVAPPPVASYGVPYGMPVGSPAEFAPNMHWALLILLVTCTCGLFYMVWLGILGARMKKIVPSNSTWMLYFAGLGIYVVYYILAFNRQQNATALGFTFFALAIVLLIARFRFRSLLEEYYTTVEPIGLTLSGVMTFFFAEYYFQYHFNKINQANTAGGYPR